MPRDCASCTAPFGVELDRQLRSGVALTVLSAWTTAQGLSISRNALSRHRRDHLALTVAPGRKPMADDLLEAIRDRLHDRLTEGAVEPSVRDGIAAVKALDARKAHNQDRDLIYKITLALTGHSGPAIRVLDPEQEALEAELRPLLGAGG